MARSVRLVQGVAALALVGCGPSLMPSRVPYEPLRAKLLAAGGDPSRVLRPARAADLDALTDGKRYKFVVRADGTLAIAPLPADAQANEYVHPVLAEGGAVRTAGGITVTRAGGAVAVVIDQDSKAYCPPLASLVEAERALARIGVPPSQVRREDRPPACAAMR